LKTFNLSSLLSYSKDRYRVVPIDVADNGEHKKDNKNKGKMHKLVLYSSGAEFNFGSVQDDF
jgi:hypothetical protein